MGVEDLGIMAGIGLGTPLLMKYILGYPFPWEFGRHDYTLEKTIEEIRRAKDELLIATSQGEYERIRNEIEMVRSKGVKVNFIELPRQEPHFMVIDRRRVFVEMQHNSPEPQYYRAAISKRLSDSYLNLYLVKGRRYNLTY